MKLLLSAMFLATILIGSFAIAGCSHFAFAQSYSTAVVGIINTNTVWTKAASPYTLTGPVAVNTGVTLTIEPGVTVNLGSYYLGINGTLVAKGTNAENIHFISGGSGDNFPITFMATGSNYNSQTGSGSILENAVVDASFTGVEIYGVSPKIDNNTISANFAVEVWDGSQIISNNIIYGGVGTHGATPTITGNTITGEVSGYGVDDYQKPGYTTITNNKIFASTLGKGTGVSSGNTIITGNIIYGFQTGITAIRGVNTIQENLIINNYDGILTGLADNVFYYTSIYPFKVTIKNNEITQNSNGITIQNQVKNNQYRDYILTIAYNNIENNHNYNFNLSAPQSINAQNNWWGTTSTQAINQTIFDFEDDFNLGSVTFVPFLSSPDTQAPSANVPLPTLATTPTPSSSTYPTGTLQYTTTPFASTNPTDTQTFGLDLFQTLIVGLLSAIAVLLIVLIFVIRSRKPK